MNREPRRRTHRCAGASLLVLALAAGAEPIRYVTDVFTVTVRTGKGNDFQILRTIDSGTAVEVLESDAAGYSRVRLENGTEGWMLTRFLVGEPVAKTRLASAEQTVARLTEENQQLRGQAAAAAQDKRRIEEQLARLTNETQDVTSQLSELEKLAARPLELEAANKVLRTRIDKLEEERLFLKQKIQELRDGGGRDRAWFLAGAGVLFGGLLLGLILTRVRWRRTSSWDRF